MSAVIRQLDRIKKRDQAIVGVVLWNNSCFHLALANGTCLPRNVEVILFPEYFQTEHPYDPNYWPQDPETGELLPIVDWRTL